MPASFSVNGVALFRSDFSAPFLQTIVPGGPPNYLVDANIVYDKEMSQDQVYHLLFGLAFVRKYMSGVVAGNVDLGWWAEALAVRLVTKLADDRWRISNPACAKRVTRGEDAGLVGGPLLEDTSYTDNLHMLMALAAVSRGWRDITAARLVAYAGIYDWYAYPLAFRALHGESPDWPLYEPLLRERVITMLNDSPWEGPTSYGTVPGWRSTHRFLRGRSLQERTPEDLPTDYNGLDFLLFYNLMLIAEL